jgi:2-keto-4-pentenoate hydratase
MSFGIPFFVAYAQQRGFNKLHGSHVTQSPEADGLVCATLAIMNIPALPLWSGAQAAAQELVRQQAVGETFRPLSNPFEPPSLAEAYATQEAFVHQLAAQRNTRVGGYKIAITTPAMRALVGFDDAISGCVLADRVYASGHKLGLQNFQHLIVEFELALQFGQDLPERENDWDRHSIAPYLDCAYPSLEIADDRFANYATLKQGIFSLVAENAWNKGVVLGSVITAKDFDALWQTQATAYINGKAIGEGHSQDVMGHPLTAMAWIANHLRANGKPFKAGDWVTTGSWVASQFPSAGQELRFEMKGLGEVTLAVY